MDHTIDFKIIQWNVNGLRQRINDVLPLITTFQPSAVVLCETHLTDKDDFTIPGYTCFRRDCPDIQTKAKGGLATYVRTDIGAQIIQTTQYNRECLCVEISFNDSVLRIISVYDNDGRGDSSQLNNIIKTINGKLYFLGDLNAHMHGVATGPRDMQSSFTMTWKTLDCSC